MDSREFLCALLARGYKKEFYSILEEDMFNDDVSKKILRVLKSGFQFSKYKLGEFREQAGVGINDLLEISKAVERYDGWITKQDVLDFVAYYRKKMAEICLQRGDVDGALEFSKPVEFVSESHIIDDYVSKLAEIRKNADKGLVGLTTGFRTLDTTTGGLVGSKVWVVGGYNAYGKTYFMTNLINNVIDLDKRVCVITLEMTTDDILDRLIGQRLGLGVFELAKSENKDKVSEMTELIRGHLDEKNLCIIDSESTIEDVITRVKIENRNRHIDVLCLDFIQLVGSKKSKSMYERTSLVSQELQNLTKEIGCTSVLLSQISNASQSGGAGDVYGFKGAGEIGQIADVGIKILREKDDNGKFTPKYILDVVKNRSGRTGKISCKIAFPSGEITEESSLNTVKNNNEDISSWANL